jgi:hypothetical protein
MMLVVEAEARSILRASTPSLPAGDMASPACAANTEHRSRLAKFNTNRDFKASQCLGEAECCYGKTGGQGHDSISMQPSSPSRARLSKTFFFGKAISRHYGPNSFHFVGLVSLLD